MKLCMYVVPGFLKLSLDIRCFVKATQMVEKILKLTLYKEDCNVYSNSLST